jgi:hypothetical protein
LLQLDIATRVVGEAENFYLVRPGQEFTLYNDFLQRSHVFLDFPGIGLDLNPQSRFPSDLDARAMVTRSSTIRDWHLSGRRGARPSTDLAPYHDLAKGRRVGKYVAALKRLLYEIPTGSIIVVPGPGYFSDVLIGEITGPRTNIRIGDYEGEEIPARPVRWVGKKHKARFSPEMIDLLKNRNPLVQMPRSVREEVLATAYDQYVIGDTFTARLRTTDDDFSTLDDYDIQTFINYSAGVLAAFEGAAPDARDLSIADAIRILRNHREAIPEFASNINSPGFLRLFGSSTIPLVIIVLLSAALSGAAVSADSVHVINSMAPAGDLCALQVEEQVKGVLAMMRIDDWQHACELARDAHEATGLTTSVRAQVVQG